MNNVLVVFTRSQLLTSKLFKHGFTRNRLTATFKKFYGSHNVLVDRFKPIMQ